MTSTVDTTRELAAFLRTRRERLTPDAAGLPPRGQQRRTPGLRREEVAELAGVSTDYVVRLEQGRGLRPSVEVLDALARALRLTDSERIYLFDLAQQRLPSSVQPEREVPAPALTKLIQVFSPLPAMLVNHRCDILAWNPEMAALLLDFAAVPARHRNALWLCLMHPDLRDLYGNRERIIQDGIADLRAAWAAHPDDTALAAMITELTETSPEFADNWDRRDVLVRSRGRKLMRHPIVGDLMVEFEVLLSQHDPDQRIIVYHAADDASEAALARLRAAGR
ncbi:helix-turn-helix domain-containing protein [Nocardia harenae]|uniref:helix-turn-helix domain-containing protein n=1 Tax=Nocardia harenae TaxID=358707 RepID=UPI00350E3F26